MRLRRIGVLSLGMILASIYAILGLIIGGFISLFSLLGAAGAAANGLNTEAFGALFGVGAIVLIPLFYAIIGFVGGVIIGLIYNLVASVTGGLEMHFEKVA